MRFALNSQRRVNVKGNLQSSFWGLRVVRRRDLRVKELKEG